jgi:hypothetical protein
MVFVCEIEWDTETGRKDLEILELQGRLDGVYV